MNVSEEKSGPLSVREVSGIDYRIMPGQLFSCCRPGLFTMRVLVACRTFIFIVVFFPSKGLDTDSTTAGPKRERARE